MPDWIFWVLIATSVVCTGHMWARASGSVRQKLLWTPILLVPLVGLLFYGSIYEALERHGLDTDYETDTDFPCGGDDTSTE